MKYSSFRNDTILDWRWDKRSVDTVFRVGDIVIGQIFKARNSWSAVHRLPSRNGGPVHGFRSRIAASQFLEQVELSHPETKLP
jgi:hypothetical protein